MRLLHTSDWHLGRGLHRVNLLEAQRAALDHLVEAARAHRADAILVSGDIYDRAVPPLAAVRLFDEVLHRLADLGVPTVMISGNHDSPHRLGVGSGLLEAAGIHLRTDPARCAEPVLLHDAHGAVACYAIPYLEPALVRATLGARRASHHDVLAAAVERVRADLATRPPGTRSVVLAHAFVTGGHSSDSERDLSVGGAAAVPTALFAPFDYTALGHLHGAQCLTDRVRYSGTPLAYSFSEAGHRKSFWCVDLGPAGSPLTAERLDFPVPRPLARLRGRLDDLLADPAHTPAEDHWTEVTLTDPGRPDDPLGRLRARFPHLLSLVFDPDPVSGGTAPTYADRLRGRTDRQVAEDFVRHVRGGRGPDTEESRLLDAALATHPGPDQPETPAGQDHADVGGPG